MSLRARLLLVTLALVAVALTAAGWATHAALRSRSCSTASTGELVDCAAACARPIGDADLDGLGRPAVERRRPRTAARRDRSWRRPLRRATTSRWSRPGRSSRSRRAAAGFSTVDLPGEPGEYRLLSYRGSPACDELPPGRIPTARRW